MENSARIKFSNFLPSVLSMDTYNIRVNMLKAFLSCFEMVFEELEAELEGVCMQTVNVNYREVIKIESGGIPDLFNPAVTPPLQFIYRNKDSDLDFLKYLGGLVGLELREDKENPFEWNRQFILNIIDWHTKRNIALFQMRGTLEYMEFLLHEWLKDELQDINDQLIYIGEEGNNKLDSRYSSKLIYETDRISFTPRDLSKEYYFYVFIYVKEELRGRLDSIKQSTRLLINNEKPAHTSYALLVSIK